MAITFAKLFSPGQLSASNTQLFVIGTSPATNLLSNGRVRLSNISGAPVAVTLYAVPSGGSPSSVNEFLPAESIAPNDHMDLDLPQLGAGDSLYGFASTAAAVSIFAMDGFIQS